MITAVPGLAPQSRMRTESGFFRDLSEALIIFPAWDVLQREHFTPLQRSDCTACAKPG